MGILDGHHLHVSLLLLLVEVLIISIIVHRHLHRIIIKLLVRVLHVSHLILHNRMYIHIKINGGVTSRIAGIPLLLSTGSRSSGHMSGRHLVNRVRIHSTSNHFTVAVC